MAMFVQSVLFWAIVATCMAQQEILVSTSFQEVPQYDQWGMGDDMELWFPDPQTASPVASPVAQEEAELHLDTTLVPDVIKEQEPAGGEMVVFKIFLVVAMLLVTVVGGLGIGYYLCVWRGGRFYYRPQRELALMT